MTDDEKFYWKWGSIGVLVLGVILFLPKIVSGLIGIIKSTLGGAIDATFGANSAAGAAAWWESKLGLLPPGSSIPDSTGTWGEARSAQGYQDAIEATTPQLAYDLARSKFAKNHGISVWDNLIDYGWPSTSFQDWQAKGSPPLPS